jgi:hypothetical protein
VGTLDDAIREHLELKRKQGASEEELERQESEALGRQSAPAPEPAAPPPEPPPAPPAPASEKPAPPEPQADAEPEILQEPDLPAADPETGRNGAGADLFDQDLIDRSSAPADEPVVRRARPAAEPQSEAEPADEEPEDFLEDTPDFLEETPEHDRLWFEQKPPKDFDFD